MKRVVCITITIDPTEYNEAEDTPEGAIDLVIDMMRGDADLPEEITMSCGGTTRKSNDHLGY